MTHTHRRRTIGSLIIAIGAATILTVSLSTSALQAGARPAPLFEQAAPPGKAQPSAMATHTIRRSILTVNDKVVSSGAILNAEAQLLNLFPDVRLLATRSRVESRSSRNYSWFGYIPGEEPGRVIVTVVNGTVGAAITHRGHRYVVLPIGDGNHEVVDVDRESFPEGDDLDRSPAQTYGGGGGRGPAVPGVATPLDTGGLIQLLDLNFALSNGDAGPILPLPDDGSAIDIMAVYTHEAAHRTDPIMIPSAWPIHWPHPVPSNLLLQFQLAIDLANLSFEMSAVPTRLNLVGDVVEDSEYVENGKMSKDLDAVRGSTGMRDRRNLLAADIVVFITAGGTGGDGDSLCGRTKVRELQNSEADNADHAFIVVDGTCLAGTNILAHEVAHDMGTTHDWYRYARAGETDNVDSRAHGYIAKIPNVIGARRTIMAYPDWCLASDGLQLAKYELSLRCQRVDQFSAEYQHLPPVGMPAGGIVHEVSFYAVADEVPILQDNRKAVANYRLSACRSLATSPLCP